MLDWKPEKKKHAGKNPVSREKKWLEIWVGAIAHSLESSSYEGYMVRTSLPIFTKHVFQQSMTD